MDELAEELIGGMRQVTEALKEIRPTPGRSY